MAVMYPQHQEIILSITFLDKIFLSSFGHEIGHNFGADHNRESGTVAPYDDAYGHWIQVGVNANPKQSLSSRQEHSSRMVTELSWPTTGLATTQG